MDKPKKKAPDSAGVKSKPVEEKAVKKSQITQSSALVERGPGASKDVDAIEVGGGNVAVVCRFRPLNDKEKAIGSGNKICPRFLDKKTVEIPQGAQSKTGAGGGLKFSFDRVFDMNTTQVDIYQAAALPIVESVLEGFNGTIFAYGQTSSGKTHTMQGVDINDAVSKGIIPRIVSHIFNVIDEADEVIEFTVKISMIEIYMERIRDLIDPRKINLQVHEDKERGVFIGDVTETYVTEAYEVYQVMQLGNENRSIGVTDMNSQSSRSHSCFILTVTQNNSETFQCKTGKLYLVDLAGSEKISKTGATGQTLDEAKKINKSLSALGMVINSLTDGKSKHIPYRDSKLTRILQESLGGNSRTCLIITCSPSTYNEAETISTLRFGQRAKKVQNKPKINKEMSVAELKLLLEQAELANERKDKRIRNLEKIIRNMGGIVPEEKDDFIQRRSVKEPGSSPKKRKATEEEEDFDEANAKIDELDADAKIDALDNDSSDADSYELGDEGDAERADIVAEEMDEVSSNMGTETSEKSKKEVKKTHKPKQKSQIDALNETFAMLEKAAIDPEKRDQGCMTDNPTFNSVKTNTNIASTVNTGTSIHIECATTDTMTESDQKELCENGIQTSDFSTEADASQDAKHQKDTGVTEEVEEMEMEQESEAQTYMEETKAESTPEQLVSRANQIKKEYSENGIQTTSHMIEQDLYDKMVSKHEQTLKQKDDEIASKSTELEEALQKIEEQKKSITLKEETLHEQLEELDLLSFKIRTLESTLSEDNDINENQRELIEKQEKEIKHLELENEEREGLINQHAEKIMTIEKDLKNKEELFKEKVEALSTLQVQHEEVSKKYSNAKHEYSKLKKENEMLVEKAASLHMSVEEITKKNQKYKKQLVYLQEEQQKKISNLKEQRVTDEMEIIKYKSLLEEKQKFLDKLLTKDENDSNDIRMIVEESYKKISDYEKSIIEQENQKKLLQQKEEQDKELEIRKLAIAELEEKYSKAKHKIHEMKNELILIQQKKSSSESKKFKDEKAIIIKTLNEKNKKIEKLEKEIESWKIKYSGVENFLSEDQKMNYGRFQNMTKNMNQIKQMYSQIVNSESVKQEKFVIEKKLKRKQAKIDYYEKELSITREQFGQLKNKVHLFLTELEDPKQKQKLLSNLDQTINVDILKPNTGIVKSRKGGKGKKSNNNMSFNELMSLSALNKNKDDNGAIKEQDEEDDDDDNDNGNILEQDEEDDEEQKIQA